MHYTDDVNVYVRSQKAGQRVMTLLRRFVRKAVLERQPEQECSDECA